MRFGADHRPRIEFYVRQGLVKCVPTDEQLEAATALNRDGAGVVERLKHYARRPLEMLPTRSKRAAFGATNQQVLAGSKMGKAPPAIANGAVELPAFDRFLRTTLQISPVRFAVQCWYNPWNPVPGTGLNTPTKYVIAHIVHAPHPTAVWDVQLIHPDPGALDELEREIEMASKSSRLKARIYRALAQRPGYYDYLRDLIPRVRRFDYPPTPPGFNPILENLVRFLNYAADLEPNKIASTN